MRKTINNIDKIMDTACTIFSTCDVDYNVKGNMVTLNVKGFDGSNWGSCTVDNGMSTRKMEQIMRKLKSKHIDVKNNSVRDFKTRPIDLDLSLVL